MVSAQNLSKVISVWGYALILNGLFLLAHFFYLIGFPPPRDFIFTIGFTATLPFFIFGLLQVKRGWLLSYWAGLAASLLAGPLCSKEMVHTFATLLTRIGGLLESLDEKLILLGMLISFLYLFTMAILQILAIISYIALFTHREEFFTAKKPRKI